MGVLCPLRRRVSGDLNGYLSYFQDASTLQRPLDGTLVTPSAKRGVQVFLNAAITISASMLVGR